MGKILGIDLGTTNSVIAVMENGKPAVIPNKLGERITPSVVGLTKNEEWLVGRPAKNQTVLSSDRTVLSIKRKIGTDSKVHIANRDYTPQEISARILSRLKEDAEEYLGEEISKAVITVPAYFNDNQRQATKEAGKIAGFDVQRIINEPTAAALAYGLKENDSQTILIYDLGGGTFDVSILEIGEGVFEVKATSGNNCLGGDDFDSKLMDFVLKKYNEEEDCDLSQDNMALQKLKEEVEKVKIELSSVQVADINIPFISADETGPKHLSFAIKRTDFEDLIQEYIEETINLTENTIKDARINPEDIDKVILVGGSTRIPFVQKEVENCLGEPAVKGVNPDECVAIGAAIQAAILNGEKQGMVLVDVTPLSLGIEIESGIFVPIIERNSTIPIRGSKLFTTISDYQKSVEIHVYQGERIRCQDNISLGEFQLWGIRPAKKGDPRVEVNFSLDVDGILKVSAQDLDTGINQKITIDNPTSLAEEKINKITEEARKNKLRDKELIDLENLKRKYDSNIQTLSSIFKKYVDEIDSGLKKEISVFIKNQVKNSKSLNVDNYKELIEQIEFLLGEIKAVSSYEKEEVEVS